MKYEWRAVFLFVCLFFLEVYYSIYSSVYYWLFLIFFFLWKEVLGEGNNVIGFKSGE